jgi:hypothetical protein
VPRGPNCGERSLDALISGTLYVFLDLGYFSSTEIEFETALIKRIYEEAVSGLPNSSKLLSKVLKSFDEPKGWIEKLFEVTNKRYLFLFIDEIGYLSTSKSDALSSIPKEPKGAQCLLFIFQDFIICVLARRTEPVSSRIGEASASRLKRKVVALSPFSKNVVKSFIQGWRACIENIIFKSPRKT